MTTPLDNVTDTTNPIAGTAEPVLTAEQSDVANTAGAVHDLFDGLLGEMPNDPSLDSKKVTILDPDTFKDPSLFPETAEEGEDLFDNLSPDEDRPKDKEPITEEDLKKPIWKKENSLAAKPDVYSSVDISLPSTDIPLSETDELPKSLPVTPVDEEKDVVGSIASSTPDEVLDNLDDLKDTFPEVDIPLSASLDTPLSETAEPPKSPKLPETHIDDAKDTGESNTASTPPPPSKPRPSQLIIEDLKEDKDSTLPSASPKAPTHAPSKSASSTASKPISPKVPKSLVIPPAPASPAVKPDPASKPKADPEPASPPAVTPPADPPKETEEEKKTREANEKKAEEARSNFYKSVGAVALFAVAFFASVTAVTAAITASWLIFAVTFVATAGTAFGGAILIKQVFTKKATP